MTRAGKLMAGTVAGIAGVGVYWMLNSSRSMIEQASYGVRRRQGKFELRQYPARRVASTPLAQDRNQSLRRLLSFVEGGNAQARKIGMTAPIFVDYAGREPKVRIVLPVEEQISPAPQPHDSAVSIEEHPAFTAAACHFSGRGTDRDANRALESLLEWIAGQGIIATGAPILALYDSPIVPPFFRRNEIMLPVAAD